MIEVINQTILHLATGFLFTLFLFTSSIKITRWHQHISSFQLGFMKKYGLDSVAYTMIGLSELLGALGLLLIDSHVLGTLAAGGLFLLSIGAFGYHLKFDSFPFGIPALLCGVLALTLLTSHLAWLSGLPENLTASVEMDNFHPSWSTAIPAAIGALFAVRVSSILAETAKIKMLNADKEDPYAV